MGTSPTGGVARPFSDVRGADHRSSPRSNYIAREGLKRVKVSCPQMAVKALGFSGIVDGGDLAEN